jgi:predicted HTH transcriptional regulator
MTAEELQRILAQGESETVEFKSSLPDAGTVARNVAALANTRGGYLVLGYDERNPDGPGLAHPGVAADTVRQWVEQYISPPPRVRIEDVSPREGQHYVVVEVGQSEGLHIARGEAPIRERDRVRPMPPAKVAEAAAHASPDQSAKAIVALTNEVQALREQMGWKRQAPWQVALGVVSLVAGYLLGWWNPLH